MKKEGQADPLALCECQLRTVMMHHSREATRYTKAIKKTVERIDRAGSDDRINRDLRRQLEDHRNHQQTHREFAEALRDARRHMAAIRTAEARIAEAESSILEATERAKRGLRCIIK